MEGLLALVAAVGRGSRPHLRLVRQELIWLLLAVGRDGEARLSLVFLDRVRLVE